MAPLYHQSNVTSSFSSPQNCWQNYVDFHKCIKIKGAGYAPCKQFLKTYLSLCPNMWVEKWNEQLDEGTFVYKDNLSE